MATHAPATNVTPPIRFIRLHEVKALTTLSTSEVYRRISAGTFPRQILIGPKSAVWVEEQIVEWQLAQIDAGGQ